MKKNLSYTCLLFSLAACQQSSSPKQNTATEIPQAKDSAGVVIRNNIQIQTTGNLDVQQAFMLRNNGSLVNDSNNVQIGELIELRLLVNGWKGTPDSIRLGASEKISTNDGTQVLDVKDLFASQPAIVLSKAQMIRMQAVVTKQNKDYDYYQVDFKVWNKNADQSLTGAYKIYVR